jgi:hypothetical protein
MFLKKINILMDLLHEGNRINISELMAGTLN